MTWEWSVTTYGKINQNRPKFYLIGYNFWSSQLNYSKIYILGKLSSLPFERYIICLVLQMSKFPHCFSDDTVVILWVWFLYVFRWTLCGTTCYNSAKFHWATINDSWHFRGPGGPGPLNSKKALDQIGLKLHKSLTTVIFTGSASTVYKLFKIIF